MESYQVYGSSLGSIRDRRGDSRTLEVMCGRFGLMRSPAKIAERIGATFDEAGCQPHDNVVPPQPILATINDDVRTV